jgi:GTPase
MARLPVVAVIGRPNVGKSSLVNRIVGGRMAVTEEMPGVTRDRREFQADWAGRSFLLIDTGGWEVRPGDDLTGAVRLQAEAALSGADLVVLVIDATLPVTADDAGMIEVLRRSPVPVVVAANKVDNPQRESLVAELWGMGLGEPIAVSALHGRGIGDLLDRVVGALPETTAEHAEDHLPRLAIIGRPNVGKSTLLNRLVGEERVIVSAQPGTTRDPIDVITEIGSQTYRLVDTAGIRRRPQIKESADFYAVDRARRVVADADVALLLVDAEAGVGNQDQRIASEVVEAGTGLVVLLNKWDVLDTEQREGLGGDVEDELDFVDWAPQLRISARTGARLNKLPPIVEQVLEARKRRLPTGELNRLVREWTGFHPPPVRKGRRPRLQYVVQAGVSPPTFVLFVSGGELGDDYLRYLEGRLRQATDFTGTPLRLVTRA